jgi:predicted CoA-substrate-specific enzyme activase
MNQSEQKIYLGLDLGSVSLKLAAIDSRGQELKYFYLRHKGQPLATLKTLLAAFWEEYPPAGVAAIGCTGTGGHLLSQILGGQFVNEVIAFSKALVRCCPQVRSAIEMGGEDSKLLVFEENPQSGTMVLADFAMNTMCAAGTGSFLDQQANRIGVAIEEEFGSLALQSSHPARIAGRCSVFAKSDMIHLQQVATPISDIVNGLCFAVARNFKGNIAKGKKFSKPIAFLGGVASNQGMIRAFEEALGLEPKELIIPAHHKTMGALGAALAAQETKDSSFIPLDFTMLEERIIMRSTPLEGLEPLKPSSNRVSCQLVDTSAYPADKKIPAYLGVDVGSISTNVVLIDTDKKVLARRYLMTAGQPIEAVRKGLAEVGEEIGERVEVLGVGTTGSGRYLTGDFIGADVVRNEITAQATAAVEIDPQVDTIFEIGGQDSKYISLQEGVVVDFEMNKACAAGTGSFLEEQAERLAIRIEEEFGRQALCASCPSRLGERCTVFMESDLVQQQQKGATRENLAAGLAYSIALNYLNKVVSTKLVGNHIFFQGGVAANQGVVAAFEKITGKKITVPPHHDVTGAIGAAILSRDHGQPRSNFKGFDLSQRTYEIKAFQCQHCSNFCEINRVSLEGERPLYYGARCERYDFDKTQESKAPDLFAYREEALLKAYQGPEAPPDAPKVGLPRMLYFYELYPFWKAFFSSLGFNLVLSNTTNKKIIHEGVEGVASETCFPIKVAHGHVLNLLEQEVDYLFLPGIINLPPDDPQMEGSHTCPYVQTIPFLVRSMINYDTKGVKVLTPMIKLNQPRERLEKTFRALGKELGKKKSQVAKALDLAYQTQGRFHETLQAKGQEVLRSLAPQDLAVVIVSRPYNGCDPGINLGLPKKLREMGVVALPMDFLPLGTIAMSTDSPNMYWRSGQKILAAARIIRQDARLWAVYITNFGCGPDSFITHHFQERMKGKPFLQIEVDEHSADAGAITRCEAFLDSLKNSRVSAADFKPSHKPCIPTNHLQERVIYLPYMSDHAFAIKAAFEFNGFQAEVLPESDKQSAELGRKFTSGKECYPCIVTTGDFVKKIKEPGFDPRHSAFFMPSADGPCRFGQYNTYHKIILEKLGCGDVPIISPDAKNSYNGMSTSFSRWGWRGVVATDLLEKSLHHIRPYEINPGQTEKVYWEYIDKVCQEIRRGKDLAPVLTEAQRALGEIPVQREERPLIGMVGEIFLRTNRFSNDNLIKKIETLGGEVWLAPVMEWIFYTNYCAFRGALNLGDYKKYLGLTIRDFFQKRDEHRYSRIFSHLESAHEPPTRKIIKHGTPYIHEDFEGEAILSVGKAVDFAKKGLAGVVSAMPFTCMPGTIVTAVSKRLREDFDNIPFLNVAYDGLDEGNTLTRLEAFMYQARRHYERHNHRGKKAKFGAPKGS